MASRTPKNQSEGLPEFAVRRETISRYFDPPLPRSTFHDFVAKGVVIPLKGIRGFYLLNESLRRLGLREVKQLTKEGPTRSIEDILRLAFMLIDPLLFPSPSWLLTVEEVSLRDADYARLLADYHLDHVNALDNHLLKLAYFGGVIDAQTMIAMNSKNDG